MTTLGYLVEYLQLLLLNIAFLFDSLVFHIKEINCKVLTYHGLLKAKFIKGLCACMLSCFTRVRLCEPMDYSPQGSSVHGIIQARILE